MFGQNIAYLRKLKGLSQRQLANELNISSGALAMYEIENREPDIKMMQKIADFFQVDITFIITVKSAADADPLLERIRLLSDESRFEIDKYTALLEMKERLEKETVADNAK